MSEPWPFGDLKRNHYGAILADPPWRFVAWADNGNRAPDNHYSTMDREAIAALPVGDLAAEDCALFMWIVWPCLLEAIALIDAWGFTYKTCGFAWMKAHAGQMDMLRDDLDAQVGRRKPDGIHDRIERLVAGPYCELFARQQRKNWDVWGNQTDKFEAVA